jgi:hypothetical protein
VDHLEEQGILIERKVRLKIEENETYHVIFQDVLRVSSISTFVAAIFSPQALKIYH